MGIVRAYQKGTLKGKATPEVQGAASSMKKKDVKKFASTKHKGLPEKKVTKESVNEDAKMAKRLFQYTYNPDDSGSLQSVGVHKFIKETFGRSAKHPILEAPTEKELNLASESNHVKIKRKV